MPIDRETEITRAFDELIVQVKKDYATHLRGTVDTAVDAIGKVISHLQTSQYARYNGDDGSADAAINKAIELLLGVLGIKTEVDQA